MAVTSYGRNKNHDDEIKKNQKKANNSLSYRCAAIKNSKNQSEIAACEQKTTTEKPNFCSNTVFSLYFKIRAKKIHAAKPLAFSLLLLFRRDQNHYSNLTSKIMKMCEQILKKKTAPQYNSNSWNCKKPREGQ